MPRMTISLGENEFQALLRLATLEFRDPRSQLRVLLQEQLVQRRLLAPGQLHECAKYTCEAKPSTGT